MGVAKASAEALGIQSLPISMGWKVRIEQQVDSSAKRAITSRLGLGRARRLKARYLWV